MRTRERRETRTSHNSGRSRRAAGAGAQRSGACEVGAETQAWRRGESGRSLVRAQVNKIERREKDHAAAGGVGNGVEIDEAVAVAVLRDSVGGGAGLNPTWRIRPWFGLFSGAARADSSMNDHFLPATVAGVKTCPLPESLRWCRISGQHVFAFTGAEEGWQGTHLLERRRKQTSPRRARGATPGALPRRGQRLPARSRAQNARRSFHRFRHHFPDRSLSP